MLTVLIHGVHYPVRIDIDGDSSGYPPRTVTTEIIQTAAPCPKCITNAPTSWEHEVTYDHFTDRKPGVLRCAVCDTAVTLQETP